ncbi:DNA-binding transcriptional LysR family regulator [Mycobacterium sp. MAA66]|uniref:LysR family transcriptional regulator n=1 Tax=Mycobacterium sp. MAA66 TaxID=3156297 RepID=UPI003517A802
MELRQLEYFTAVAAELNFSRAAERIHVVQSALSAAVAKLEKELGVELFDRTKRQIALTAAGEAFLDHAREVIHASRRAQASMDDFRGQLTGSVTVGTLMSWGALNLPVALEDFHRRHRLVTVHLRQSLTGSTGHLAAIADGQMDLALVSIPVSPSPRIALTELTREPMVLLCAPDHRLAGRNRVQIADLAVENVIRFPPGWGIRKSLDAALAAAGIHPVATYEVADYAIAAELIRHRLATAVLPASVANRFPDLFAIPVNPAMTWTLFMATTASQYTTPAASTLALTLRNHIEGSQ